MSCPRLPLASRVDLCERGQMGEKRMGRNTWPTRVGYEVFLDDCEQGGYKPRGNVSNVSKWLQTVVGNKSKIDVVCKTCSFETTVVLRNFHIRKSAKCFCNGSVPWESREGHERLLQIIAQSRFKPTPEISNFALWSSVKRSDKSVLPIVCTDCNIKNDKVIINTFVRTMSAACGCRYKTEAMVGRFVESICCKLGDLEVSLQEPMGRFHGTLRCDIVIKQSDSPILAVEVDGDQHFRDNTGFGGITAVAMQRRDLQKEENAMKLGCSVLRVFQESVWESRFDWKTFIEEKLRAAMEGTLPIGVYCQTHPRYTSGVYVDVREGAV